MRRIARGEGRGEDHDRANQDKLHPTTIHWRSMSRFTVVMAAPGRLVETCKRHLAVLPVDRVGPLIAAGGITVNGAVGSINQRVAAGDVLEAGPFAGALVPEPRTLAIVFEDDDLIVVDKPAGLHLHPLGEYRLGTLLNGLLWHAGARPDHPWAAWRPHPAHRLDRGASGLLAIAKRAEIHDALRTQLASGAMERRYRATVEGVLPGERGTIDGPLGRDPLDDYRRAIVPGGQPARTHYTVVARGATTTTLELQLETGRTHQIRAHLASLGHPIVGDTLYGAAPREPAVAIELRAIELELDHRGERRRFVL
jgi:23S rRNA pseudouridine1911/1915/1917 synthase